MIQQLETRYGTMFVPDTDNGQYWWLETTGASPEDEMIEAVCALLDERPRGMAIDVGANFGCWTLALARHATEVCAYEAQRCVFEILSDTVDFNLRHRKTGGGMIYPHHLAIGDAHGTITVPDVSLEDATNFGGISLGIPHPEHPDAPMREVPVYPLDFLVRGDFVSFIKADVEGFEMKVFQGAVETIRRCKPIIIAEADHPLTDTQALGAFIESLGYNVEIFQDNNFIGMPL